MNAAKRNQEHDQRERTDVSPNQVPEALLLGGEYLGRCTEPAGGEHDADPRRTVFRRSRQVKMTPEHKAKMQQARLIKAQNAQSDNAKSSAKTIISADPALDSLLHPQAQQKLKTMPEHCRKTYRLAMTGKRRNAAIRAACQECMGYQRADVPGCTSHGCPLYPYRPGANR